MEKLKTLLVANRGEVRPMRGHATFAMPLKPSLADCRPHHQDRKRTRHQDHLHLHARRRHFIACLAGG